MSVLRLDKITGRDGTEDNSPMEFIGDKVKFNSHVEPQPGTTVQNVVRHIRGPYTYSTGSSYYEYFADLKCFKTKIKTRYDNSALFVTMWLNGEPGSTHDWVWGAARNFQDRGFTTAWNNEGGMDMNNGSHETAGFNTQWRWYLSGFTNPGTYSESDYSSTPSATRTMHFMDNPRKPAGTEIWYTSWMQSTGNHTYYVNRCVNNTNSSSHERGASGVRIEEIKGPCVMTRVEGGSSTATNGGGSEGPMEEFHFGDTYITGDRTSSNTTSFATDAGHLITYPSE
ncbi:MAG: hypothetical protein VX960_04675 [Candidatus Neomarinimicrobiota bacterium]|nr:hypothetical protein [Candidatus Neomarinimicrobiota bacterium]